MLRKILLLLLASTVLCAEARTLSPEEALSAAMNDASGIRRAPTSGNFKLARTINDRQGAQAVYVFTDADRSFIITAADDCAGQIMLGYGDKLGSELPSNMKEWLDSYASQIEWLRANNATGIRRAAGAPDKKEPIVPLLKTQWGQDEPYNKFCPMMEGETTPTGCAATAAAQILNYHKWPKTGYGTSTYSWSVNGVTYTDSFDYENTTFDWDNMLDSYAGEYTEAQADAVATLMHGCGVAFKMAYNLGASGTTILRVITGLVNNLACDLSMELIERSYYTDEEWNQAIYDALTANMPVFYQGITKDGGGHAFVCDGYSANGFFHINWGWDGLADGYFILSMLDPINQGTGGGESGAAYNYNQAALVGIQPEKSDPKIVPNMILDGELKTDESEYARQSDIYVVFSGPFISYAISNVNYDVAIASMYADGTIKYSTIVENQDVPAFYGWNNLYTCSTDFPEGEYDVFFVFRETGTDTWHMFMSQPCYNRAMHFVTTSTTITVSDAQYYLMPADYTASITKVTPEKAEDNGKYYSGHTYNVDWQILSSFNSEDRIGLVLCNADGTEFEYIGTPEKYQFEKGGILQNTQSLTIPMNVAPGYTYIGLAVFDAERNTVERLLTTKTIMVIADKVFGATFVSATPKLPYDDGKFYAGHSYTINSDVSATGAGSIELRTAFVNTETMTVLSEAEPTTITFDEAGNKTMSQEISIPDDFTGEAMICVLDLRYHPYYSEIIEVIEMPENTLTAEIAGITPLNPEDEEFYPSHSYEVVAEVTCHYHTMATTLITLADASLKNELARTEAVTKEMKTGDTVEIPLTLTLPADYLGEAYIQFCQVVQDGTALEVLASEKIDIVELSGITTISVDDNASAEYFTLQGVKVSAKDLTPGLYLRRTGDKAEKILVK